jgi:hypothetical protein
MEKHEEGLAILRRSEEGFRKLGREKIAIQVADLIQELKTRPHENLHSSSR